MREDDLRSTPKRGGRMPLLSASILCLLIAFILAGCGGGGGVVPSQPGTTGTLRGTVYTSDGVTPLAGATVYVPNGRAVAPENALVWTTSGSDGTFVLENVPTGTTTIKIEKDSLSRSFDVNVQANATVELPKTTTTMPSADGLDTPPGDPFPGGDPTDPPPSNPFGNNGGATGNGGIDGPPAPPF